MSSTEGCGKTTLGQVMLDIFGQGKGGHGLLCDDKDQLLGKFNGHLETVCFVLGEEVLWAGDPRTADAFKSRITAGTITVEEKYRKCRQVPSRLHVMLTTNHTWSVPAGVGARRYFVVEVSDEVAQDHSYFDPLYADLKSGGTGEFLQFLLSVRLADWHPREVPKTVELATQQELSAGSVQQWLLACAEFECVVGAEGRHEEPLGTQTPTQRLYRHYCGFTKTRGGVRAEPVNTFGRVLTAVCGPSTRLPTSVDTARSPGYHMPAAMALRTQVHRHLKMGGA
jgi:hypothetical protein